MNLNDAHILIEEIKKQRYKLKTLDQVIIQKLERQLKERVDARDSDYLMKLYGRATGGGDYQNRHYVK